MRRTRKKKRLDLTGLKKGALHKALRIPAGKHIPTTLLRQKLKTTRSPLLKKRIQFALNARRWKKGKKKK